MPGFPAPSLQTWLWQDARRGSPESRVGAAGASLTSDANACQRPQHQHQHRGPEWPRSHLVRPPRRSASAAPARSTASSCARGRFSRSGRGGDAVGGTQRGGPRTCASSPRALFWTLSWRGGGGKTRCLSHRHDQQARRGWDPSEAMGASSADILVLGSAPEHLVCLENPGACGPLLTYSHLLGDIHVAFSFTCILGLFLCTLSFIHSHIHLIDKYLLNAYLVSGTGLVLYYSLAFSWVSLVFR